MMDVAAEQTRSRGRAALPTVVALLAVYMLGREIPLPGIAMAVLSSDTGSQGLLGLFTGNLTSRVSVFALGLLPLFTAMALVEIAKLLSPALARWQIASARNLFRLNDYIRLAALVLAATQGLAIASALNQANGLVADTPGDFIFAVTATCVGATALLSWLADRISLQGLVNGFWLLWILPSVEGVVRTIAQLLELARTVTVTPGIVLFTGLFVLATYGAIAVLNLLLIDMPLARDSGEPQAQKALQARLASMAIVWPPLLANFVLGMLGSIAGIFNSVETASPSWLRHGTPSHAVLDAALIMLFCYAYSRRWRTDWRKVGEVFSEDARESSGSPIPFWVVGLVLIVVCNGGELVDQAFNLPFLSGSSVTVVTVTVVMGLLRALRLGNSARDGKSQDP